MQVFESIILLFSACGALPSVTYAAIAPATTSQNPVGTYVVECLPGYLFPNKRTAFNVTCQSNFTWTNMMYTACDKYVSLLPSPPPHSDSLGGDTSPLLLRHIVKFVHLVQCTVFGR